MKNKIELVLLSLCILFVLAINLAAQDVSIDKQIEEAEKKVLELKKQKLDALKKQAEALEKEINPGTNQEQTRISTPQTTPQTQPQNPPAIQQPQNPTRGTTSPQTSSGNTPPNGGGTGGTTTPQTTTGNQVITECRNHTDNFNKQLCYAARDVFENREEGLNLDTSTESLQLVVLGKVFEKGKTASTIQNKELVSFVADVESKRTDKQIGSDSKGAGSTSLVTKGGIPAVFNWAVERGAVLRTFSGTTANFRFNPVGLLETLTGQGYIGGYIENENKPVLKFLRKTSLGISFDISRGQESPLFTGDDQQISVFNFRYELINERDPRNRVNRGKWDDFFKTSSLKFVTEQAASLDILIETTSEGKIKFKNPTVQKWLDETNVVLSQLPANASVADIEAKLREQLNKLPVSDIESDPNFFKALIDFVNAQRLYISEKEKVMEEILKQQVATFEYTNHREINEPDTHNFAFIWEKGTYFGMDFTFNTSLTFFNKRPVAQGVKRIRDFSFAGQFDIPLKGVEGLEDSYLSLAGKYQRQPGDITAFDGTVVPNTRGNIWLGQAKLTLPAFKKAGIRIPISVTFSNRTELVREKEVRGNFGFTFDLDPILARLKPF